MCKNDTQLIMMSTKGFMAVYFNQSSGHSVTNEQKFKLGEHRTMDNEARQSDNTGQIKEVISLLTGHGIREFESNKIITAKHLLQ